MSDSVPNCPICDELMTFSGHANYYGRSSHYNTPIYYCKLCDIFYRDIKVACIIDHSYAASYVQEKKEASLFYSRKKFFEFILSLVKKYKSIESLKDSNRLSLIDFGSSYGHLIYLAKANGIEAVGIELVEDLLISCKVKDFSVYKDLKEVPKKVDVVTAIDSLYYVPNCKEVLADIRNALKPNGILLVRVNNRNLYVRLRKKFIANKDLSMIGDAIISFPLKGIKKLFALTGFQVIRVIPDSGKGKRLGIMKGLCYRFTYVPTILTGYRFIFTPGFFVVAKLKEKLS